MIKRTKLRYLVAPIWIVNIIFLFGSIYSLFSNEDGQLPLSILSIVGLFFVFFIYLYYDITKFNRPIFLKIIGSILVLSGIYYFLIKNYLLIIPVLITGFLTFKYSIKIGDNGV